MKEIKVDTDLLKLDMQVCFPLYAASREITQLYGQFLSKLDITYPQYLVLMVLWEHRSLTVNQIGNLLLLDSGTLTPLLKRMESKELLTRNRAQEDERVVNISLTPKGEKMKKKACDIPQQFFENLGLTINEANVLKKLTRKILNNKNNITSS